MITRIEIRDDDGPDVAFERERADPYKWYMRIRYKGAWSGRLDTTMTGAELLWQMGIAAFQGNGDVLGDVT